MKMQRVMNFRDAKVEPMSSGLVYRSARLDDATNDDLARLELLNIKTVVDLRGNAGPKQLPIESIFKILSLQDDYSNDEKLLFKVEFSNTLRKAVLKSLSWLSIIIFFILQLLMMSNYARKYAIRNSFLGSCGVGGLYQSFLLNAGPTIKQILELFSDKNRLPILVHCAAGKDRTGVIIALVQSICGCHHSDIVANYKVSEKNLDVELVKREVVGVGLGAEFAYSPESAMQETLGWIENNYGSVSEYLVSIGVGLLEQEKIKSNLVS